VLSGIQGVSETPQLERYEILSELGRGAMGVVYKARDTVLERIVAIKAVNMSLDSEGMAHFEARFYQEARAAGGLNHPNIVTIYDIGRSGNIAYIAMEYIEGQELRKMLIEGKPLPVAQAAAVAAQVSEGLAFAHERGIVHRDIKPANIMVVPDKPVKITDFGIARMRASSELTMTGMMLGSPKYMSPEQALGKRADHRSDIFSLGVILYEMLTGVAPFRGENINAIMYQIVNFAPPTPSALNREVPAILDYIVAKMLAKPLDERYQSAAEAGRELRECERLLAARASATRAPHLPAAALSAGATVTLLDTDAKTVFLAQSAERTRRGDDVATPSDELAAESAPPVLDSLEATKRLASFTGLGAEPEPEAPTQGTIAGRVSGVERHTADRWRGRDWMLVAIAALLGFVVAAAILKAGVVA
jgi:serine/threonine-protein kinase